MIHLDHLITTKPLQEVIEVMQPWLKDHFGSASSVNQSGIEARDAIDLSLIHI